MLPPIELGPIHVAAGEPTVYRSKIPWQREASDEEAAFDLLLRGVPAQALEGFSGVVWNGVSRLEASAVAEDVAGGSLVRVQATCRPGVTAFLLSPALITQPLALSREVCSRPPVAFEARFFPRTEVRGRLRMPKAADPPETVFIRAAQCAESRNRPAVLVGSYPVAVSAEGRWSVGLPAGCLDVTLQTAAFAPVTWPALALEPAKVLDVGDVELTAGAALLVRAVDLASSSPLPGATLGVHAVAALPRTVQALLSGDAPLP